MRGIVLIADLKSATVLHYRQHNVYIFRSYKALDTVKSNGSLGEVDFRNRD